MPSKIKITLIEDHPEYRDVIKITIEKEQDLELQDAFGSAERALRILETAHSDDLPNIILLDLNLPGMSGLEAIAHIKHYSPKSKIIILSQSNQEADVLKAIQTGASGYLLKSSSLEQITSGIKSVSKGGAILDPHVAQYILDDVQSKSPTIQIKKPLSPKEFEILSLMSNGMLKKEIASELGISMNTVVKHIVHIYEKLEVQNSASAISKAYQSGIL